MHEQVTKDDLFGPSEKYTREKWLERVPWEVRQMALKYPPATRFLMHGKICHLIAYQEDGVFLVTELDPCEDYEKAVKAQRPVCECCLPSLDSLKID